MNIVTIKDKIWSFTKLEKNWDSYDGDPPNSWSIMTALYILKHLEHHNCGWVLAHLIRVSPSCINGIGFIFEKGDGKEVYLEIYNSGLILVMFTYEDADPFEGGTTINYVHPLNIDKVLDEIFEFYRSGTLPRKISECPRMAT